jgi:hypothetical protein
MRSATRLSRKTAMCRSELDDKREQPPKHMRLLFEPRIDK